MSLELHVDANNNVNKSSWLTDFKDILEIGHGQSGRIYQAEHILDRQPYAIKVIPFSSAQRSDNDVLAEVLIQCKLKHPFIIQYHSAWVEGSDLSLHGSGKDHNDRTLFIQMELAKGGTLSEDINNGLHKNVIRRYRIFREIVKAVSAMHLAGITHGDLHPRNIFLDKNDYVKIGDFGLAKSNKISDPQAKGPRTLDFEGRKRKDMNSLGTILLKILHPPIQNLSEVSKLRAELIAMNISAPDFDHQLKCHILCFRALVNQNRELLPTAAEILGMLDLRKNNPPPIPEDYPAKVRLSELKYNCSSWFVFGSLLAASCSIFITMITVLVIVMLLVMLTMKLSQNYEIICGYKEQYLKMCEMFHLLKISPITISSSV